MRQETVQRVDRLRRATKHEQPRADRYAKSEIEIVSHSSANLSACPAPVKSHPGLASTV